ncbi:hypothetical protein KFK09_005162 [Dendrobium nobile]|uniref:Uncharacterized protein n=1 Tax=Dendrobium nobile TaxID=94219 RepID=A0A8T3BV33_DENNO|nr:hypothetical protein KFK09_005162 [Dendrobium nobile]
MSSCNKSELGTNTHIQHLEGILVCFWFFQFCTQFDLQLRFSLALLDLFLFWN